MAKATNEAEATKEEATEASPAVGSVLVEWVGTQEDQSQIRKITAADFKSVSVDDQHQVVWDRGDHLTRGQALVSARAAEYLLEIEQGFAKVEPGKEAFKFRS
jgi:hypothetical protein